MGERYKGGRGEEERPPSVKQHKGGRRVTLIDLTGTTEGSIGVSGSASPTLDGLDQAARSPRGPHPIHRGSIQGHWTRR